MENGLNPIQSYAKGEGSLTTLNDKGKIDVETSKTLIENVDFSFIVSGSERIFIFPAPLNALPTMATLVREIKPIQP